MAAILIVDDEEPLAKLMSTYLGRLGYRTTIHLNATEALAEFNSNPSEFSLLIADLSLPDLEGSQMALQMTRQNLKLQVLLCSGYPFDPESLPADVRDRFDVLQKPFLPKALAEAVQRRLPGNQA